MKKRNSGNHQPERNWAEILCFACTCLQFSWRRVVVRKWLNISTNNSDYSADTDSDSDSDQEYYELPGESRFKNVKSDACLDNVTDVLPRIRRRKSETLRAQYINTKEIRVCAATWNVGGRIPPIDLDLDNWLDTNDPADIYVIGLQEIIPLNAGNIFGAEDSRPVSIWENIIRETLSGVSPVCKFKSFSDPPSPSKFKPSQDIPDIEEEILLGSDSDAEEEVHPSIEEAHSMEGTENIIVGDSFLDAHPPISNEYANIHNSADPGLQRQFSSTKNLGRLNCLQTQDSEENAERPNTVKIDKLNRTLSGSDSIGLSWPEPPLHLLAQHIFEKPTSFKSFKASKSFRTHNSFKSNTIPDNRILSGLASLAELNLESLINRKRRPPYVRIVSKQMVGIFITIWVRRSLRRHIHNLNVSTVGVGAMGYIGNKGSVSVSMSIHQTLFCFICAHLTSGDKEADIVKRNADVYEIHRRTRFNALAGAGLPKSIYDHEKIIWLGDLNYRIDLPYEKTRELINKKEWPMLLECDQLKKGRAFDGWSEGVLNFAPTYKFELNSESYSGQDPRAVRRTPAWCDRILSFGMGMKLLSYRRSELMLSDHRPVTASYMVEVEVFSSRKLQRALTFTDTEIEDQNMVT